MSVGPLRGIPNHHPVPVALARTLGTATGAKTGERQSAQRGLIAASPPSRGPLLGPVYSCYLQTRGLVARIEGNYKVLKKPVPAKDRRYG